MSKKNLYYNYLLSILSVIIIIFFYSCNHDKQSDVAYYADVGCNDLISMSEQNINWIKNYRYSPGYTSKSRYSQRY